MVGDERVTSGGGDETEEGGAAGADEPSHHPRVARTRLADARDYQDHLAAARRARLRLGEDVADLDALLARAGGHVDRYTALAEGRVEGRRRPPVQRPWKEDDPPRRRYLLCIDECGSHQINPRGDRFPVFGLCGVIIDEERYLALDRDWQRWKANWLGSPKIIVHEPEVRGREGRFHRDDAEEQMWVIEALDDQLEKMDFVVIAAVIHKPEFQAAYGTPRSMTSCLRASTSFVWTLSLSGSSTSCTTKARTHGDWFTQRAAGR